MAEDIPQSRYALTNDDLKKNALNLQIGQGMADRMDSIDAIEFLERGEDWIEEQVEEFIGVPLKPTRAPGQSRDDFDPDSPCKRNYPNDFIEAAIYRALSLLLVSEYFENDKNASASGDFAMTLAWSHVDAFKDRLPLRVGRGRHRHPNVHMPPTIAPRQDRNNPPGMLQ